MQPLFIRNTFASRNLKERKDVPPCEVRSSNFFTMTKIKILENEMSGSVRTMTDERGEMTNERGESSFVGKDVAKALVCSKPSLLQNAENQTNMQIKEKTKKSNTKENKKKRIVEYKYSPIMKKKKKNNRISEEKMQQAAEVLKLYNMAIKVYGERYPDGWPCRLALARKVTPERVEPLCYIASLYSENEIKTAFWNAVMSPYCNGRKKERSRPADIMWLVQPKVFIRLLEGNV